MNQTAPAVQKQALYAVESASPQSLAIRKKRARKVKLATDCVGGSEKRAGVLEQRQPCLSITHIFSKGVRRLIRANGPTTLQPQTS